MTIDSSSYSVVNSQGAASTRFMAASNTKNVAAKPNQADKKLSVQQQQEIQSLKNQDQAVRNHEQSHLNAATGIAVSPPHYSYTTGPDGKQYATGGEVSIDASAVPNDPEATIRKAEIIRRAALAPASPSSQDYSVAAQATAMEARAEMELMQKNTQRNGKLLNVQA